MEANNNILLAWVPGHSNIPGNTEVDLLANVSRALIIPKPIKIDSQEVFNIIKNNIKNQFYDFWNKTTEHKEKKYAKIQDNFPKKKWFSKLPYTNRRHITSIIRMRSGHCLVGEHLHRIGIRDSPYCECGNIETLDHIFFECPITKLPGFNLYECVGRLGFDYPCNMNMILSNISFEISKLLMQFLDQNKIKL